MPVLSLSLAWQIFQFAGPNYNTEMTKWRRSYGDISNMVFDQITKSTVFCNIRSKILFSDFPLNGCLV